MKTKRTHRIICEALESRRLLSAPVVTINYLDSLLSTPAEEPAGSGISWVANIPLHVTALAAGDVSAKTEPLGTDSDPGTAYIESEYQWNFDTTGVDPGGEYDTLNGFNAAHIYTTPGTYYLTLIVTNQDNQSTQLDVPVTVDPDPTTAHVFYVAATTPSGSNDSGSSPCNAMGFTTFQSTGLASIPSDSQILFKNGDEFDLASPFSGLNISQSNIEFSNYGTGSKPLFVDDYDDTTSLSLFSVSISSVNVVFDGLAFLNNYPADSKDNGTVEPGTSPFHPIDVAGANDTVENCDFTNLGKNSYAIDAEVVDGTYGDGLLVQNNNVHDVDGNGYIDYFVWDSAFSDVVIDGNNVTANTDGTEGITRFEGSGIQRVLIADNTFGEEKGTLIFMDGSLAGAVDDGVDFQGILGRVGFNRRLARAS